MEQEQQRVSEPRADQPPAALARLGYQGQEQREDRSHEGEPTISVEEEEHSPYARQPR